MRSSSPTFRRDEVVKLRHLLEAQLSNGESHPLQNAFEALFPTGSDGDRSPSVDDLPEKGKRKPPRK